VARLRHKDIKAISASLLELYSLGPLSELPERVFRSLACCLACDIYCYNEFDRKGATKVIVDQPEFRASVEDFNRYVHQHPSITGIVSRKIQSPVKISDFTALQQWQRSDLYNSFFRLEGQNFQLGFLTLTDYPRLGIALNRSSRDFSEEERTILALLQPHLVQAYRNSRLFSLIFNASDATNYGFIVADRSFKVRFLTPNAARWLEEYFGGQNQYLPSLLTDWFKQSHYKSSVSEDSSATAPELKIRCGLKMLAIQSLSPFGSAEYQLVLTEIGPGPQASALEELGLTKREAEVLYWVSEGKRNAEIALILAARPKTITKHLERIFEKLSVETRTAAAAVALNHLKSKRAESSA
jgi:DNA-binding CsgD family transcriptional regulator